MADASTFADFLRRIRAGDEQAAAELVRRYESAIRVAVRLRLGDARLRRGVDSMGGCQAGLGSFFVPAPPRPDDPGSPEQLVGLLATIARRKVAYQARRHRAGNRDLGRDVAVDGPHRELADPDPSPSRVASGRELLAEVRRRLAPDELRLADLRAEGREGAGNAAAGAGPA